ncbi:kinase-like protein [Clathrospora elynae]|uniref:cyclin-dependent kinase n=1 Tax=Clathrospora elynae TaxID=706981 RepID=A0A6A5T5Y6_9PLEO|nr:kinase-like protein [Clathrospora elynae]
MASRWANEEADKVEEQRRKKDKEDKKRLKLQKQQEAEAAAQAAQEADSRPAKRRRLSNDNEPSTKSTIPEAERKLLRFEAGGWSPCRHTSNFETLNHIEEGSYGWVSRARDITTNQVVALKKVKMDYAQDGFPITALREISILQKARHTNIVRLQEILSGDDPQECVLVMEFLEHDLKTLQEEMSEPFLASEVKTLLRQLTSAMGFLHENYIMHRDLKTSNILLNNRGQLKLADFGMARYIPSSTTAPLTQLVVTLWYRAPELLLGTTSYGTEVDLWSLGCIFAELLTKSPILPGKNEVDQLSLIFSLCGLPSEKTWPAFYRLPNAKSLKLPREHRHANLGFNRAKFPFLTASGITLLSSLLALNPNDRPTAAEVLEHGYFKEQPKPKPSEMFPTFPSKAGQERRRKRSPDAPKRGEVGAGIKAVDFSSIFKDREEEESGGGGHRLRRPFAVGYPFCRLRLVALVGSWTATDRTRSVNDCASVICFEICYTSAVYLYSRLLLGPHDLLHLCPLPSFPCAGDPSLGERDCVGDLERVGDPGVTECRGEPECAERGRLGDLVGDRSRDRLRVRDRARAGDGVRDGMIG